VRPTADRVREALFNILGARVSGASFLDAYAGTGAVGVEALSRGALSATFIEKEHAAVSLLRENLDHAGVARRTRVVARDLAAAIRTLESDAARFDIVYLDPPYEGGELDRALRLIGTSRLLVEGSLVVAEHDARIPAQSTPRLAAVRTVSYGRTALTFYHRSVQREAAEGEADAPRGPASGEAASEEAGRPGQRGPGEGSGSPAR
jgi:16S rRNA (guanine(966)-N(2))-methyltransferase RsmD